MARLKMLAPRLGSANGRIGGSLSQADRLKQRDVLVQWRAWYKTARWQRLRWQVLVAAGFRCAMCGVIEADTSRLVADHATPHRGDEALFWDRDNLKCLCKPCHDRIKQAEERRGVV